MADLLLSGILNLKGDLKLAGDLVKASNFEVLVVGDRGSGPTHGNAPAPVPIPPPPATPQDPGLGVWIFQSFNSTVTVGGKKIVAQGMCAQGDPNRATWPGMVQPSIGNPSVTINNIPINVKNDMGIILPTGAPVIFNQHGQG